MIYFTSDLHLGHKNIIKYCNRPFKDEKEMDDVLISNWNSVVEKDDFVYILGDFTKICKSAIINDYLIKLNGKKILIFGNHDEFIKKNIQLFDFYEVCDYKELIINSKEIVLFHYPIFDWKNKKNGAICLHGHVHGKTQDVCNIFGLFDVGVDANNFYPVSLENLLNSM
jgi:calcineurin-like phosphoesterase family protein